MGNSMKFAERVAKNVFNHRTRLGWSQQELADRAGLLMQTVWRIEQGTSDARAGINIHALARAFRMDIVDLARKPK